jgi:hydantoinase/carbamoylase family amidase
MSLRRDALAGAARLLCELRELARRTAGATANVGKISVAPGGTNVIPGVCDFTIDVRAPTMETLEELDRNARAILDDVALDERLDVEISELYRLEPVELNPGLTGIVEQSADTLGVTNLRLSSGAGHDAMILARHVPSAMLFVPSRHGISHSPKEYTSDLQCKTGAQVLAQALQRLASRRSLRSP